MTSNKTGKKRNCEDNNGFLCDNLISFLTTELSPKDDNITMEEGIMNLELTLSDAVKAVEVATAHVHTVNYNEHGLFYNIF